MNKSRTGFTIVELLIVIVVIAILAAIAIVAYNGLQSRAVESSMKSELGSASKKVELEYVTTNTYPADAASADSGQGLKSSSGTTLTYILRPYGACISASNPKTSKTFVVKSNAPTVQEGNCNAVVSTMAGDPASGFADGNGTNARFSVPSNIDISANNDIYVADRANNRIRKVTASGDVSTIAGTGAQGAANGAGTSATFFNPNGVAVDSTRGIVYVADWQNHRIRKITLSDNVVSTFAGSGAPGFSNGTTTAAQFYHPIDIAVDSSGMVYVADQGNNRIRKITPEGIVTTLAGTGATGAQDGAGTVATFSTTASLDVGPGGIVYVADETNFKVRKIMPDGTVSTLAGSGSSGYVDGAATVARFSYPEGIAVDAWGYVYVADSNNNRIRMVTPTGVVSTFAGSGSSGTGNGAALSSQFSWPVGIVVDKSGNLIIAEQSNGLIRKIAL